MAASTWSCESGSSAFASTMKSTRPFVTVSLTYSCVLFAPLRME